MADVVTQSTPDSWQKARVWVNFRTPDDQPYGQECYVEDLTDLLLSARANGCGLVGVEAMPTVAEEIEHEQWDLARQFEFARMAG